MKTKLTLFLCGLIAALICFLIGGFIVFAISFPETNDAMDPRKTDTIIVLTGGSQRIQTGISLLKEGKSDRLLVSGVGENVDRQTLIKNLGITDQTLNKKIILDYNARNTRQNALEAALFVNKNKLTSVRLVTSVYHMRRSLFEFKRLMPDTVIVPHPVFPARFKRQSWWRWPGTTSLMISEYLKYLGAALLHNAPTLQGATPDRPK